MARYATVNDVRLALRAPTDGAASWGGDTYTALLADCLETAETVVDDMSPGWAPFSSATVSESRDIRADGAATYDTLSTGPFTVAPTDIVLIDKPGAAESDEIATNILFEPEIPILASRPGKNIKRTGPISRAWIGSYHWYMIGQERFHPGRFYRLKGATWGWASIPKEVKLATIHIAARSFMAMREPMGIIETSGGAMYMPTKDPAVRQWLNPYLVGGIV